MKWFDLIIRVLYTESRSWKTWLLTARLCSNLKGSNTTPSRTGKVRRRSSLGFPTDRRVSVTKVPYGFHSYLIWQETKASYKYRRRSFFFFSFNRHTGLFVDTCLCVSVSCFSLACFKANNVKLKLSYPLSDAVLLSITKTNKIELKAEIKSKY